MGVEVDFGTIALVTGMFAARNIAMGFAAGFALFMKDSKYLLLVFLTGVVIEVQDLLVIIAAGALGLPPIALVIAWTIFFFVPEIWGAVVLWRLKE